MSASVLLDKLIDIQRSVGIETADTIRNKLMDAQDYLLRMEKARLEAYRAALEPCGIRKLCSHIYSRS
jgi:hypothetical protein